ncbi:MAG: hypothetical protein RL468_2809 [Pseudomonadota bacterium]
MKRFLQLALAALCTVMGAQAQVPAEFRDADLALGQKLMAEHKCAACHVQKVGGDGSAIFKPAGRINTPGCAAWWSSAIPSSTWVFSPKK